MVFLFRGLTFALNSLKPALKSWKLRNVLTVRTCHFKVNSSLTSSYFRTWVYLTLESGHIYIVLFVYPQIEKFFPHILEKEKTSREGELSSLSPEELVFAKQWVSRTHGDFLSVAHEHEFWRLSPVTLMAGPLLCVWQPGGSWQVGGHSGLNSPFSGTWLTQRPTLRMLP